MNIIFKRLFAFLLSFVIVFSSVTFAYAASPSGWTVTDSVVAGATSTITAIKGVGANGLKAVVTHKPTAVAVGKELVKGAGLLALAYAASQLLGAGVDWVLDPANNRIKYNAVGEADSSRMCKSDGSTYSAKFICDSNGGHAVGYTPSGQLTCGGRAMSWQCGSESYPIPIEKYIPIDTVAAQVISNAQAGHADSKDFVAAVAVGQAAAGDLDTEFQAAAVPSVNNPADTDNPDVPVNPDVPADPTKPFDPSSIIAAIKSVMTAISDMAKSLGLKFDALIANDNVNAKAEADVAAQEKIDRDAKAKADKEFADWAQTPPKEDTEDTTIAIPNNDVLPADTDINFGGSCPANFEVNSSIFGNPINIVLLDTAKFCGFLSTFVKFPVYAVSSLFALYILGGRKDV